MSRLFFRLCLLCISFALLIPIFETNAKECHWYCKRNNEHKQPVCDTNFSYIKEYGGIYVDTKYNDENDEKVIYLTFDVGYENGNVQKIMDVLKSENVKGSFFILGNVIEHEGELVKQMALDGHSVCNHTFTHKNLVLARADEFNRELNSLEEAYKNLTGKEMSKFFRPPEGTFDEEMLKRAQNLGYKTVFWSFAYADWDNNKQMSKEAALKKILDNIHNGEIMLLHPTSATNAEIMQELIQTLKAQGYRFATLDEFLE